MPSNSINDVDTADVGDFSLLYYVMKSFKLLRPPPHERFTSKKSERDKI